MNSLRRMVLSLVLLLGGTLAHAHNLGTSYSQWTLDTSGAEVQARVPQLQLSRLQLDPRYTPDYLPKVGELLAANLQLWAGEQRCPPSQVQAREESEGWVTATWRVDCPSPKSWLIRTRLFESVAPSHLHFVRVDTPGSHTQQQLLNFAAPSLAISQNEASTESSLLHFISIGIQHILSGWDHLAFILMLILLAGSLRDVAWVATGFTVAHSLTLAAASLGWVLVDQARVEALIGFSIALVAAENLWLNSARDVWIPRLLLLALLAFALLTPAFTALTLMTSLLMAGLLLFTACYFALLADTQKPQRWRLALTFIFGLVHGFGFAGLMGELHLSPAQLIPGLLGFNIGVELGQLFVIALIWPLLLLLRRHPRTAAWGTQSVSAAVAGLGVFWFATRLLV
ncbi:MAG: HupE/UreJ family protein [Pseudomonadota bacterium]